MRYQFMDPDDPEQRLLDVPSPEEIAERARPFRERYIALGELQHARPHCRSVERASNRVLRLAILGNLTNREIMQQWGVGEERVVAMRLELGG